MEKERNPMVTTDQSRSRRASAVMYWTAVTVLLVLGLVAIFSIGAPLFLLGVTLAALGPFRYRRRVFWPVLTAVVVFIVGLVLLVPLWCTSSAVAHKATHTPATRHPACANA